MESFNKSKQQASTTTMAAISVSVTQSLTSDPGPLGAARFRQSTSSLGGRPRVAAAGPIPAVHGGAAVTNPAVREQGTLGESKACASGGGDSFASGDSIWYRIRYEHYAGVIERIDAMRLRVKLP